MPLICNENMAYFVLTKIYKGNHSNYFPEIYNKVGNIFSINLMDSDLTRFKKFMNGENVFLHFDNNMFGGNFESDYFECINIERVKKFVEENDE